MITLKSAYTLVIILGLVINLRAMQEDYRNSIRAEIGASNNEIRKVQMLFQDQDTKRKKRKLKEFNTRSKTPYSTQEHTESVLLHLKKVFGLNQKSQIIESPNEQNNEISIDIQAVDAANIEQQVPEKIEAAENSPDIELIDQEEPIIEVDIEGNSGITKTDNQSKIINQANKNTFKSIGLSSDFYLFTGIAIWMIYCCYRYLTYKEEDLIDNHLIGAIYLKAPLFCT